ncbi:MAG: endosialidase [Lachnospiraceae bacterium]|nr:endosialidase [Lachnospiraceae bacterium]
MAAVEQLIREGEGGVIYFGNHLLTEKKKLEDFPCLGDLYKVKTYQAMTKLEKNGMFLYESVPGTSVGDFKETDNGLSFRVEGNEDAQLTVGLKEDTEYEVFVGGESIGRMKTNLGGKLSLGVELSGTDAVEVKVVEV